MSLCFALERGRKRRKAATQCFRALLGPCHSKKFLPRPGLCVQGLMGYLISLSPEILSQEGTGDTRSVLGLALAVFSLRVLGADTVCAMAACGPLGPLQCLVSGERDGTTCKAVTLGSGSPSRFSCCSRWLSQSKLQGVSTPDCLE